MASLGIQELSSPQTGVSAEQKVDHKLTQHKTLLSTPTVPINWALSYSIHFLEENWGRITLPLFRRV